MTKIRTPTVFSFIPKTGIELSTTSVSFLLCLYVYIVRGFSLERERGLVLILIKQGEDWEDKENPGLEPPISRS